MQRKISALLLLTSLALTGCGVTGTLKTPGPLFSEKTKKPVEAEAVSDRQESTERDIEDDPALNDILEDLDD